jgi:hypothetical protein
MYLETIHRGTFLAAMGFFVSYNACKPVRSESDQVLARDTTALERLAPEMCSPSQPHEMLKSETVKYSQGNSMPTGPS